MTIRGIANGVAIMFVAYLLTFAVIGWRGVVTLVALSAILTFGTLIVATIRVDVEAIRRALGL